MKDSRGSFGALFLVSLAVGTIVIAIVQATKGLGDFFQSPKLQRFFSLPEPPFNGGSVALPDSLAGSAQATLRSQGPEPPKGFSREDLSPYYGQVQINTARPGTSVLFKGYAELSASYLLKEPAAITGWRLRSDDGVEIEIPGGVADVNPRGILPGAIMLSPGGQVRMYTNVSASGYNLRVNKCIGYLNNIYRFQPPLPASCPALDRSDLLSLPGRCQTFFYRIGSCEEPTDQQFVQAQLPQVCTGYIRKLTGYGNCYRAHSNDPDFFSGLWYVWLDKWIQFDEEHDRIFLLDEDGLIVDEYIY